MEQMLTITRPDDWHIHLRDGAVLANTVADAARYCGRAIVMPNLTPPVQSIDDAQGYLTRIQRTIPANSQWQPLLTLYLTDQTTPALIQQAAQSGIIYGVKLYPAGATTNSEAGVHDLTPLYPAFAAMEEAGLPLLVHGEVTDADVDIFDREQRFLAEQLAPLCTKFPKLSVVVEHITTTDAVDFVLAHNNNVAATITPQHLLYNRNHMLVGGIKPHFYCLPILKRRQHQERLRTVATSGNSKFFMGTDSAPHSQQRKENACGCAGCYSAFAALELYAEVFEEMGALDKLEAFSSFNGADFYGLNRNTDTITLVKQPWQVPETLAFGSDRVVPLRAGEMINWRILP
ncbi:dihydroorotase [Zooshikella marina]|uniref:dihydroorotase n=1 Tax=Zooshikella ganghwensis TaxID=202772 RepID=UPI001BAEF479|nr:dihydroorotase [Zooshikella ganghwensis]MBU2704725.1 dihydroorotase [Zooshikella ganghwensis]